MKSFGNKQVQQAGSSGSGKRDLRWEDGTKLQQKQYHQNIGNGEKKPLRREVQGSVDGRQMWEECKRRSAESVSSANGWLHTGVQKSPFFYTSILH